MSRKIVFDWVGTKETRRQTISGLHNKRLRHMAAMTQIAELSLKLKMGVKLIRTKSTGRIMGPPRRWNDNTKVVCC